MTVKKVLREKKDKDGRDSRQRISFAFFAKVSSIWSWLLCLLFPPNAALET